jgi:hypothetical protein
MSVLQLGLITKNRLVEGTVFLGLILMSMFSLKLVLSDCTFLSTSNCKVNHSTKMVWDEEIKELDLEIESLKNEIQDLECPPAEIKIPESTDVKIDAPLWNQGKIESLNGCWSLDWDYEMQEVDSGRIVGVKDWKICFKGGESKGHQHLVFEDLISCEDQIISGKFSKAAGVTKLHLDDQTNLKCDNNVRVLRRQLVCFLADDASHAMCDTRSLSEESWSDFTKNNVRLRRLRP